MTEPTGRELDREIAEALGWKPRPPFRGNTNLHREWDSPNGLQLLLPMFHASVDALREVEPEGVERAYTYEMGAWFIMYHVDSEPGGFIPAKGSTEPEARARALLKWLKRDKQ